LILNRAKVVTTVPIGAGVDANAFDPGTQLAFSSNGEDGNTTIAKEVSADKLTVVQVLKTVVGARTMALDPRTHKHIPSGTNAFLSSARVRNGKVGIVLDSRHDC
jgi:hypothetical protein